MKRLQSPDVIAVGLLILLWLIFFWRLFTPVAADQISFKQGDFSGQFVAFGAYQYERMSQGEIPLWNPYNNGGFPFIADTQAAVFYPPRLLTIAVSSISDGWSYNALQMEAVFHVLLYSLLMYYFVRRLSLNAQGSVYGAFIAAIIAAYGGFISGYPPLQLALLEAAIWLPLGALGILEASRGDNLNWRWLLLAGFALGLSWLAGHPQTSWFLTYLLVAWLGYRVFVKRYDWYTFVWGTVLMGIVTLGVTAVTLLPGLEYLTLASRGDLGFDAKGNGFPFQDVAQFIFPSSVSLFSPLYVGIPALILVFISVRHRAEHSIFWFGVAVVGLLHSFGANTFFYQSIYNFLPGLSFFRGQERAAFLVANSLAILSGLGAVYLVATTSDLKRRSIRYFSGGLLVLIAGLTSLIFVGWLGFPSEFGRIISPAFFSTMIIIVFIGLLWWFLNQNNKIVLLGIAALIVFELFSVNMGAESNYDSLPATEQLSMNPPSIVQTVLDDSESQPFRVDGFRGVQANYGSLYNVMDIRGISPLFLSRPQELIYRDYTHNPLAWELFAVRYVFSEREAFSTSTEIVANGTDRDGAIVLHELSKPRPFALLMYHADVVDSDEFAQALLNDPRFDLRQSVIVQGSLSLGLPDEAPEDQQAAVTIFEPERIVIDVDTPENALLSIAQVDYPGWRATLNGEAAPIFRAYGALIALEIPAGEHTVELIFDPISYRIGAILSLLTWGGLFLFAIFSLTKLARQTLPNEEH